MAKLLTVFILQLLSGGFSRTCWGSSSVETVTVRPGENVTLPCTVPASPYMAWYQLTNNELELILSVSRKKANMDIIEDYNNDSSHFLPVAESSDDSVSLFIRAVEQSDIGLYYCSGQPGGRYMIFGQAVHLTFPDEGVESSSSSVQSDTERSPDPTVYWIIILILTPVCLIQTIIIFLCGVCYRVTGKCCSDPHSTEKDVLQCGSLQYSTATTGASEGSTASASDIMIQTYPHCTSGTFTAVIFEVVNQKKTDDED